MEFNFNIERILKNVSKDGVAFLSGEDRNEYTYEELKNIQFLLDRIGELSANVTKYIILIFKIILGTKITFTNNIWI